MAAAADSPESRPVLDPIDRTSEVLFGLFMVLTFTGTLSVATAGRDDVREMMIAAIGCNVAWGFVDAVMYVLRNLVARGRQASFTRAVQRAARPEEAHALIAAELRGSADGLGPKALEALREWLCAQPVAPRQRARPTAADLRGALGVFLLVTASTFPPVLPFIVFQNLPLAMRVSAAIALAMLFVSGYSWGRYAGLRPVWVGAVMMVLGAVVTSVVIALGG
ncbi:MAG: VIT1/CCC1 transporter family protein [Burkholderiaceae bacterium]|nr:VIT1/CCC1 transporter family protein [Burkholderiaceae bacterium]